ncbi:MAG: hypothetical protein LBU73_02750 [Helicobacteraceae bacterium]|jgi:hypothetical protein|nr:hypothetical protein [Helicobacteraceae bacterium]
MKKALMIALWVVLSLELLVVFTPKTELYFLAEEALENKQVFINGEQTSDFGWYFRVAGGDIFYGGVKVARNDTASLFITLFYNQFQISDLMIAEAYGAMIPARVDLLRARHTILFPHRIFLSGEGEFGELSGHINLFSRKIFLTIYPPAGTSSKIGSIFAGMEKTEKGFLYESDF